MKRAKWYCNSIIPFSLIKWNLFLGFCFLRKRVPHLLFAYPVVWEFDGNCRKYSNYCLSTTFLKMMSHFLLASSNGEQLVLKLLYGVFVSSFSLIWIFSFKHTQCFHLIAGIISYINVQIGATFCLAHESFESPLNCLW